MFEKKYADDTDHWLGYWLRVLMASQGKESSPLFCGCLTCLCCFHCTTVCIRNNPPPVTHHALMRCSCKSCKCNTIFRLLVFCVMSNIVLFIVCMCVFWLQSVRSVPLCGLSLVHRRHHPLEPPPLVQHISTTPHSLPAFHTPQQSKRKPLQHIGSIVPLHSAFYPFIDESAGEHQRTCSSCTFNFLRLQESSTLVELRPCSLVPAAFMLALIEDDEKAWYRCDFFTTSLIKYSFLQCVQLKGVKKKKTSVKNDRWETAAAVGLAPHQCRLSPAQTCHITRQQMGMNAAPRFRHKADATQA